MTGTEYFHILELKIDTKHTTKHPLHNRNLARKFGTHVEDSFVDGIYQNLSF